MTTLQPKRVALAAAVFMIITGSCRPALSDEAALNKRIDELETRIKAMELILPFLRAGQEAAAKKPQATELPADGKADLAKEPPALQAHLDKVKAAGKDILGKQIASITVTVVNPTNRDIGILNGGIVIEDKAGDVLGVLKWEHNQGIGAGKTVTQTGSYADDYTGWVGTLLATDPAMMSARMKVRKIAFKDGAVETYEECGGSC